MKPFGLDRWWIIPSNPKAILGKTSQKRSLWLSFGHFLRQSIRNEQNISSNSNLSLLESQHPALGGYPALHQQSTREKSGIDLILGIIPHLLQSDFDLLFLADLIHIFRICATVCKGYKIHVLISNKGFDLEYYYAATVILRLILIL